MSAAHIALKRSLVCVLVLLAAACSTSREDPASQRTNTVIVGVEDMEVLLPDMGADVLIYSHLVAKAPDGELKPRLARRWDFSADGRVRTWHLRDDVRWHDGQRLTAHDVKFTLELLSHPKVTELAPFDEVTAVDDWTVRVASDNHDYDAVSVIYPKHLLEDLEPSEVWQWDFWTQPVGTGPFRFVRYARDRFIELEANPSHFEGMPSIERVILKFIGGAGVVEALAGNVDIVRNLKADSQVLAESGRFRIIQSLRPTARVLYLNHHHPLFSDSCVRRAVALAIDRRAMQEAIGLPRDFPLTDVLYTPRQFARGQLPDPLPHDPDEARRLLDEAGWVDADGDGVRERGGVEARFSLLAMNEMGHDVLIQDHLRRIGLAAEIDSVDSGVARQRVMAGDFDAAVNTLLAGAGWRSRFFGANSVVGYKNSHVVEALSRAMEIGDRDPDALESIYEEIQDDFLRDIPVVILHRTTIAQAIHKRIKGLGPNLLPLPYMADLWIEAE